MKPAIRQKTNIIIDLVMFVVMILLTIIGIVMRYTLIPGSERWVKYGQNVELTILGMDRHEWGLIHLIVGIFLIGLLVLHMVFHWKQIVCMVKKLIPNRPVRTTIITSIIILSAAIIIAPLLISPKIGDPILGKGQRAGRNGRPHFESILATSLKNEISPKGPTAEKRLQNLKDETIEIEPEILHTESVKPGEHLKKEHTINIRGYNTFSELADEYNISAEKLKKLLGIPSTVSDNDRLGRVRRTYDFTMSDVEGAILKLQGNGL